MENIINKTLSVIVPIYNVDNYLEKCISSIIKSTYKNLDIILVDDGSKDSSGIICDEFANNDSRIRVIHKENGGLVSARKAGMAVANGDYVTFVDGDDYIEPDVYCKALAKIVETNTDFIGLSEWICDEFGNKVKLCSGSLDSGVYKTINYESYTDDKKHVFAFDHSVCTKIFKTKSLKDVIESVENSLTKGEDLNIMLAYMQKCNSFCLDYAIAGNNYVCRDNSITHKYDEASIEHTANYVNSSLKLCNSEYEWNRIIYNYALNMILSDCIGCTFEHFGKKGFIYIVAYFKKLVNDKTFNKIFYEGDRNHYYSGDRAKFVKLLYKKAYLRALIMRVQKKVQ